MRLENLSDEDILARLKGPGLSLRTGPFVTRIRSRIPAVAEGIGLLYGDYLLAESGGFADFHVGLARPPTLRRWFRPQAVFDFDGHVPFKPLPADQAYPLLEWGLNWCVSSHAHQYLMIHGAVIEKDGRAALLPAPPGAGKSTLCAALVHRGWRLLSDELTLIRRDGRAVPLPRPVSLKNASIGVIRGFEPSAVVSREVRDTLKGTVAHMRPPGDAVARADETARPGWIVFPRYQAGAAASLQARAKGGTLMAVADNAFNYSLLGLAGFHILGDMIDACDCYDFRYGDLEQAVEAFAALPPPAS